MNNILQKAGRTCFRLRKILLKNKTQPRKSAYEKRRNYCVNFFEKKKKNFFEKLETRCITVKSPGE